MRLTEDKHLLAQFKRGDPEGLKQVYLHYAPKLYAYLSKGFLFSSKDKWYRVPAILDPVEQENLVQETFIRCFAPHIREKYDATRPYLPYLQRTCQRLFIEQKRLEKRIVPFSFEETNEQQEDTLSQQDELETKELLQLIDDYLQACSSREKKIFDAIFHQNKSQRIIANELGLSRMQVRTSLQKLRAGLLKHLQQTGYLQQLTKKPYLPILCWFIATYTPTGAE